MSTHYPSLIVNWTPAIIGCDCGWEVTRTQLHQAVLDYANHTHDPSPVGPPAPAMDPSERANGGMAVASRTGTDPAGEATSAAQVIEALATEAEAWADDEDDSGAVLAAWLRRRIPPGQTSAAQD